MPFRLVGAVVIWFLVTYALVLPISFFLTGPDALLGGFRATEWGTVGLLAAGVVISAPVALLTVYLAGRYLDRRTFRDFGLAIDRTWWTELGFGLGLGAALMTGIFLVELGMGWIEITGLFQSDPVNTANLSFLPWFLLALITIPLAAFGEELLVRGYVLKNLAEGFDGVGPLGRTAAVSLAVVLSSVLFGLKHVTNPNASGISTTSVALAGILLALGFVLTRSMAIPFGLHISWNFFQGLVYGFPISGSGFAVSMVRITQGGPETVTGGAFGPEAGLIGVAAILLGMLAIVAWVRVRYGHVRIAPTFTMPALRSDEPEPAK
jgi:membrane protease YdiL (CAAX protease family)